MTIPIFVQIVCISITEILKIISQSSQWVRMLHLIDFMELSSNYLQKISLSFVLLYFTVSPWVSHGFLLHTASVVTRGIEISIPLLIFPKLICFSFDSNFTDAWNTNQLPGLPKFDNIVFIDVILLLRVYAWVPFPLTRSTLKHFSISHISFSKNRVETKAIKMKYYK